MKKLLLSSSIASLLLPAITFAAFNDVSLTTEASLSVNSITMNVSGSAASIESIAVGDTTFTVTLQANSNFEVTAPNLNQLATNQQLGLATAACSGTISKIGYTATSTEIVAIITPSATLCSSPTEDTSGGSGISGGSSGGGGGGGGSPAPQASPVAQVVTTQGYANLTPAEKQVLIAQIRTSLASLIQQLITLLQQQVQAM